GVNAGRVFYDDGKINVIFGELQSGYRKRNVYGQRTEDFTPRQEGLRTKAADHQWALAARPGVELHSNAGGVRNDWVEIDSAAVVSGAAAVSHAPSAQGSAAAKSSVDLEQRLKTLKDLRDKNLISEEAYRAKMQELLSEL
ncbi:MAG TPA: SHOCT domain-containing protein, partial [Steroidobacteraceae bacterium]|nr:SHOCT domain-containing protein [Steroidobacteraceae bacterium]